MKKVRSPHHEASYTEELRRILSEWISREAYKNSLISVTKCTLSEFAGRVTVYISVYPQHGMAGALSMLRRHGDDIASYFVSKHRNRRKPFFLFEADVAATLPPTDQSVVNIDIERQ